MLCFLLYVQPERKLTLVTKIYIKIARHDNEASICKYNSVLEVVVIIKYVLHSYELLSTDIQHLGLQGGFNLIVIDDSCAVNSLLDTQQSNIDTVSIILDTMIYKHITISCNSIW